MTLVITNGEIRGCGTDKDGDFEVYGAFLERQNLVTLTRRYTRTTEPSQSGVGIPYEYEGTWDGHFVSGEWRPRWDHSDGGPFEMWPASDENELELWKLEEEGLVSASPRALV